MAGELFVLSMKTPSLQLSTSLHSRQLTGVAQRPLRRELRLPWNFAEWYVLSQTLFPALLYLPGSQPFRVPIRMAAYGVSLVALVYFLTVAPRPRKAMMHPAVPWLLVALAYLALMILHPATNSLLAGLAEFGLVLAVLSPIFWMPPLVENSRRLQRVLWLTLLCSGLNAFVGVMQVRSPAFWLPREFSTVFTESALGLGTAIYEGANGETIIRPPGLSDAPGAVAGPAMYALFLGLVFATSSHTWRSRITSLLFAAFGACALFYSMERSFFLIAIGMVVVYLLLQVSQRRFSQIVLLAIITLVTLVGTFLYSAQLAGPSLFERFGTIVAGNPLDFYYENRGNQVAAGFVDLLPKYPLGAGLGRWGMVYDYFGNQTNTLSPPIWVEIQIPAFIVDGGLPLLLLYPVAVCVALWQQFRAAHHDQDGRLRQLAAVSLASNAGLLALCFSYAVFVSPLGMQFWGLSGAVFGASRLRRTDKVKVRLPPPAKPPGTMPLLLP